MMQSPVMVSRLAQRLLQGALVAACLLTFSAAAQAPVDIRIALVIGNSAYANAPLVNPANDARAMGDTLRGLGFTVIELRDGQKEQMADAIRKLGAALKGKQGVGLLYYAGHALQLDWRNYMVPVNAILTTAADVPAQTVDVHAVIDTFRAAGNRMNIVVLDACRDNPFAGTASGKGLAQLDAPPGTFLAFATAPGNVAEDGDPQGGNGLYTRFLLEELKKPVAKIEDVFKRVRFQVRKQSQGRQIPWESTSLEDDFFFNTGKVVAVARSDEKTREIAFNQEKADWDRIRDSKNAAELYEFLQKYPNGNISELAQARLERLDVAKVQAQADRTGAVQSAAAARYRIGDRYEFVLKDGLSGVVTGRASAVLRSLSADEMEGVGTGMVSARVTAAGFVTRDGAGSYDPPWPTTPGGEFQVGKKWNARSIVTFANGSKGWVDIDARITAREMVTVPLGTLDTYRVDYTFLWQDGRRVKMSFWYQPDLGYAVKLVRESRSRNNSPEIFVREMSAFQRAAS